MNFLLAPFCIYLIIFVVSAISGGFLDIARLVTIFLPPVGVVLMGISLVIMVILGIVSIILTLIVDGYLLSTFQNILDKRKLVKFGMSEILGYVIRAIKGGLISFAYALPGLILITIAMLVVFGGTIFGLLSGGNSQQITQTFLANIIVTGIIAIPLIMLAVLFFLIAGYFLPAAISIWLKEDRAFEAFNFGRILKNVFKLDYLLSLVVAVAVSMILGLLVLLVTGIIVMLISLFFPSFAGAISSFTSSLMSFVVAIILYSMLAQVIE
ncbi:MAG: DUF4013 domain-containing protein [archaeon]